MNNIEVNKKIEQMLKDDNIVKIMNKASKNFTKQLDSDEIYTSQINALWKAIINFKEDKNTKFTTYLYRGVLIDCIKQAKFKSKLSSKANKCLHSNITNNSNDTCIIDIIDEVDNEYELDLILDKYKNLTIVEMAKKRNISRETVRLQIKKTFENIRKRHS